MRFIDLVGLVALVAVSSSLGYVGGEAGMARVVSSELRYSEEQHLLANRYREQLRTCEWRLGQLDGGQP